MKFVLSCLLPRAALLFAPLMLCSCTTFPNIGHAKGSIDDASQYEDFILLPIPNQGHDPAALTVLGEEGISLVALKQHFESRGFNYSSFEEADLLVGVRAAYIERERIEPSGNPLADLKHTYPGIKSYDVVEGEVADTPSNMRFPPSTWIMIVEVYQKDPLQLIWSGWCSTANKRFFADDENRLQALDRILQDFPR